MKSIKSGVGCKNFRFPRTEAHFKSFLLLGVGELENCGEIDVKTVGVFFGGTGWTSAQNIFGKIKKIMFKDNAQNGR